MSARDHAIANFVSRHPWSLGPFDAAFALCRPGAALRQKLFVMTAVLEARPQYCDRFVPVDRSRFYAVTIAFVALRAALRSIGGLVLLPFVR